MTPRLAITTAVLEYEGHHGDLICRCVESQLMTSGYTHYAYESVQRFNTPDSNLGVTGSLQWLYEHTTAPIIAFFHSDLEIHERGWDQRVLREFDDPSVGVVGFGGARQLGTDDIYKTSYRLQQLARVSYMSNQTDWETHGAHETGERDVATLDGFALVVRRELLSKWEHAEWLQGYRKEQPTMIGEVTVTHGWPVARYPFHNYDNALCLEAAKQGYRVRLVGVSCTHHGGATSTTPAAQDWWRSQGTTDAEVHEQSHLALYEDGRGYLPICVAG